MIALRTNEGICFTDKRWKMINDNFKKEILSTAKKWQSTNHLLISEKNIQLTNKGKFLADGIAADLFQLS